MLSFLLPSKVLKKTEPKKSFVHLFRSSAWPLKIYVTLFLAFFLGITLLILSRLSSPMTLPLEKTLLNASGYFFSFLHTLEKEVATFKEAIQYRYIWHDERKKLEADNLLLRQKLISSENINHENRVLRQLLNVVKKPEEIFVTAPVLSNPKQGISSTFLIGAGTLEGVRKGQPVLSLFGVVGQIHQVAEHVSRVLPITHRDSRIPIVGLSSRVEAIIAGDGSAAPLLTYLQENTPLTLNEIFVTSRYGGRFPYGYVVGRVKEDDAGQIRIHPFILWDQVEFVQVMVSGSSQTPHD